MRSTPHFSTLIYHRPLFQKATPHSRQLLKDLEKEVLDLAERDIQGQRWSQKNYRHGYTSYGSLDQLYQVSSNFSELQKLLDSHVKNFCQELDWKIKGGLAMNSLWGNVMGKGSVHTSHLHPHSVLSGSFYLEPGKSPLKFEDPRLSFFMNSPLRKGLFVEIQPKVGDVILFESWLRHEVPENKTSKKRLSLSFNYDWKK